MKRLTAITLTILLALSLSACGDIIINDKPAEAAPAPEAANVEIGKAEASEIRLSGSSAEIIGGGASVSGSVITVSAAGEYRVSGTLEDGCIVVNTGEDAQNVTLILENAGISCSSGPAIRSEQAKKLTIELPEGSANSLVSGTGSEFVKASETAQGAVIFSEDDLVIRGSGSLAINGTINNGITGKDDVKILGGSIVINAANNGIRGSESVQIEGGEIVISAMNDGIKSTSAVKENKGFITIEGGSIVISAEGDGISSAAGLTVNGGSISVSSNGGELYSGKCMKSDGILTVNGGELVLESAHDKALSSDTDIFINGGSISVSSGDDGISSRTAVNINAGSINIASKADGIKAGEKGGTIGTVALNGGSVVVCAALDPVDAKGGFEIRGGSLTAAGNAKHIKNMIHSELPYVQFAVSSQINAKTQAVVTAGSGYSVSLTPERGYKLVAVISPEIIPGTEYTLTAGSVSVSSTAA